MVSCTSEPRILAQTDRWLVVDKPAGWLTIFGRGGTPESSRVLKDWASAQAGPVWVVHRIDRETSGIVLFARTAQAHRQANLWFEDKSVRKRYECLCVGRPSLPVFKVSRPIEGKPSLSQVEVRERFEGAFLATVRPQTGRRHQIRIHLSGEGFPLLGDPQYGGPRELGSLAIERVALHASRLELPGGEVFESPLPEDFQGWIEALKKGASS